MIFVAMGDFVTMQYLLLLVDVNPTEHQTGSLFGQVYGQVFSRDAVGAYHLIDTAASARHCSVDDAAFFEVLTTTASGPWRIAHQYLSALELRPAAVTAGRDGYASDRFIRSIGREACGPPRVASFGICDGACVRRFPRVVSRVGQRGVARHMLSVGA